jgi:HD-GYP domain-containing protein (c-di-GMP phosphodiesterase class II)
MRLCPLNDLREGMVVARPVYDDRLDFLLSAGQRLSETMINRLRQLEVFDIYIEEAGTEDIEPPVSVSQKTRRRAQRLLRRTFDELTNIAELNQAANEDVGTLLSKDGRYRNAVQTSALRDVIKRTLSELINNNTQTFEVSYMHSYLNYHYEHALNTMILSLVIARGFHFSEEELLQLGLGALLHDLGKIAWPKLAQKRRPELSDDEVATLQKHPIVGAKIIGATVSNSSIEQAAVRCHHERQDGKGYPYGLTGSNREPLRQRVARPDEIFRMAEIIAVANAFDNLQKGVYSGEPLSPIQAAEALVRQAGPEFNTSVVNKAVSLINVYPVGALVVVKFGNDHVPTGLRGVVRRVASENLKRPGIVLLWNQRGHRIAPLIVDLDTMPDIQIELI